MRFVLSNMIILFFNVLLTLFMAYSSSSTINGNIQKNYIKEGKIIDGWPAGTKTIVIDPGHGGKDNGTSYGKYKEKNITLKIALKLKKSLESKMPDLNIVLTRSDDIFVPLYKRIDIANKLNADLFVSIHCNSYKENGHINGVEVFTLGITDSEDNLDIAMRENASVLLEQNHNENYDWYDPTSIEAHIFLAAFQNIYLEESIMIASEIGHNLKELNGMKNRGVKQSGFVILKQATMPSVLIETGFLSNATDRRKLTSANGQKGIAEAISKAIFSYFGSYTQ